MQDLIYYLLVPYRFFIHNIFTHNFSPHATSTRHAFYTFFSPTTLLYETLLHTSLRHIFFIYADPPSIPFLFLTCPILFLPFWARLLEEMNLFGPLIILFLILNYCLTIIN